MTPAEYAQFLRRQPARERQRLTRIFQGALSVVWGCLTVGNPTYGSPGTPVDTGFALASWWVSIGGLGAHPAPPVQPPRGAGAAAIPVPPPAAAAVALVGADLERVVYFANGAAYIVPLELGHSGQAPVGWVRLTALAWPAIVRDVAAAVPQDGGPPVGAPGGVA